MPFAWQKEGEDFWVDNYERPVREGVEEVARQLARYVVEGSKEWKDEVRRAKDRLYKRLKRRGEPTKITKHEIHAEMLHKFVQKNFRANMGRGGRQA